MKVAKYDFTKSNKLKESVKFTICRHNSKYNEANKTWTVELPQFFTDNEPDYRQIKINQFIYYTPNGCSDLGTTFHSEDLFDADLSRPLFLIVGGEKRGISKVFLDAADLKVRIPYGRNFRGSLTSSAACAVCAFEVLRRERKEK